MNETEAFLLILVLMTHSAIAKKGITSFVNPVPLCASGVLVGGHRFVFIGVHQAVTIIDSIVNSVGFFYRKFHIKYLIICILSP